MMNDERRAKLRVFLRVGMFAIAAALSAIAIIRIFAVTRQIRFMRAQVETAQNSGEELKRENDQLTALSSLCTQHRAAARRNVEFVSRFYQLCREPSDLPSLKTDFIISGDGSFAAGQSDLAFSFSVPDGSHTLQVSIGTGLTGRSDAGGERLTKLKIPLIPSAGYFVRVDSAADPESETNSLSIELTSNNSAFQSVREILPLLNAKPFSPLPPERIDVIFPNDVETRFLIKRNLNTDGKFLTLSYPNSQSLLDKDPITIEHGLVLATCYIESNNTPMVVRLSIISDSPECLAARVANTFSKTRSRLKPYSGNGRIYIQPKN